MKFAQLPKYLLTLVLPGLTPNFKRMKLNTIVNFIISLIQVVEAKTLHTIDLVTYKALYICVNALALETKKTLY